MEPQDVVLVQSYFALAWWAEALNQNYFQHEDFLRLKFKDKFVQGELGRPGCAARSLIMPSLYVALVLPRETFFSKYAAEFERIDLFISSRVTLIENSYPPQPAIQYTRHLRNATTHSRVQFKNSGIQFEDQRRDCRMRAEIEYTALGGILQELNLLIMKHVESLKAANH